MANKSGVWVYMLFLPVSGQNQVLLAFVPRFVCHLSRALMFAASQFVSWKPNSYSTAVCWCMFSLNKNPLDVAKRSKFKVLSNIPSRSSRSFLPIQVLNLPRVPWRIGMTAFSYVSDSVGLLSGEAPCGPAGWAGPLLSGLPAGPVLAFVKIHQTNNSTNTVQTLKPRDKTCTKHDELW